MFLVASPHIPEGCHWFGDPLNRFFIGRLLLG